MVPLLYINHYSEVPTRFLALIYLFLFLKASKYSKDDRGAFFCYWYILRYQTIQGELRQELVNQLIILDQILVTSR
jgi:hypothetical protein